MITPPSSRTLSSNAQLHSLQLRHSSSLSRISGSPVHSRVAHASPPMPPSPLIRSSLTPPPHPMAAPSPSMGLPQPPPSRKVHVVYYLSRAGQLEHPHLLQVAISPTEGLYLRDVKKRLAMIRGKRLPSTFAWSYKRSYKNGYVWQDLCDDDLIFPAHGCEYVLKGSEIITEACEDKCLHTSALCSRDENQELSKIRCQESSTETNVSLKQCTVLDKSAEGADAENVARGASVSNSRSHIIFEFGRSKNDSAINPVLSPVQSSSGRFYVEAETSGDEDVRSLRNHTVTKPCSHVSMVENGTDAATQTEEEKALRLGSKSGSVQTSKVSASPQNPSELNKIDMSSPPSSSSTTSPLAYKSASKVENPSGSEKNGGSTGCWKRAAEEQDDSDPGTPSDQTSTRKSAGSQDPRGEEASARPKAKHSGASSLLQFVSCGGLDIKQQMLPMSLYLKSKGSQHPSTEHFCDVLYAGQSRSWNRMGKNSSKLKNELNKNDTAMNTSSAISPISERLVNSQTGTALGMGTKDSCITPQSLPSEAVLPDVISIGRSSVSDRSTNVSRELDYQTDSHWKRKHSGEIFKSSPRLGREILDYQTDSPRSKASGEIKGSPLFVAGECSSRLGLLSNRGLQKDAGEKPASKAGSGALSDREVRDTVNAVKRGLAMGEKGGYESMAQLWEELLAPKGDFKDGDQRGQALSCNVWERTLQNAVDLSLPPLEFLVLHECPHCSRKFKPELLKAHMKSCNTLKCSKSGAPGKSSKSDANICQRLLNKGFSASNQII